MIADEASRAAARRPEMRRPELCVRQRAMRLRFDIVFTSPHIRTRALSNPASHSCEVRKQSKVLRLLSFYPAIFGETGEKLGKTR